MSVYVITHKKFNMIPQENYKVLLVGAYRGHVYGDCFDDAGDNISEKNAKGLVSVTFSGLLRYIK